MQRPGSEVVDRRGRSRLEADSMQGGVFWLCGGFQTLGIDMEKREKNPRGPYEVLLNSEEYASDSDLHPYIGIYDRRLPCCGCGVGWFSFLAGFLLPLFWYYGTIRFLLTQHHNDPRERPGLAACAIATLVSTVALVIALIVLLVEHKGWLPLPALGWMVAIVLR